MAKRQLSPLTVTGNFCVSSLTIQSLTRVPQTKGDEATLNELAQQVANLSDEAYAKLQNDLAAQAESNHTQIQEVLKRHLDQT